MTATAGYTGLPGRPEEVQSVRKQIRLKKTDANHSCSRASLPALQEGRPQCHLRTCSCSGRKPKGGGGCAAQAGGHAGGPAVSEFNVTYVVERSLYSHLNLTQLVRPASDRTLSKAEKQDLRCCWRRRRRPRGSGLPRWTAVLRGWSSLEDHQKSVSHPEDGPGMALLFL